MISELKVYDLFFGNDKYEIPLYQRAYAWKEKEIEQLIEDIYDIDKNTKKYYLGSLIVAKNSHAYEVIDGQQRLTTLFIILKCLGYGVSNVSFSCREKSNYTLKNLTKLNDYEQIEESIRQGKDTIKSAFRNIDTKRFIKNLTKVIIYRIEVPKHTDLNRYFEIMNTRGEQLEQHDILKATLMSKLTNENDKAWFARIWNACSDMTGYVQMHFDTSSRKILFGADWRVLTSKPLSELEEPQDMHNKKTSLGIEEIIEKDIPNAEIADGVDENDNKIRFNSIIEFPHFLLHVLRVFVTSEKIDVDLDEQLDDKKLCLSYKKALSKSSNGDDFVKKFIMCLLWCRFLFDKYIIKREFSNDDLDGEWSLKELMSTQGKSKKAYYVNTVLKDSRKQTKRIARESEERAKSVLMLQACYRVSYTSPKVMHWITTLLKWLFDNKNEKSFKPFATLAEQIGKDAVKRDFLDAHNFSLGVGTPHIVFNYLDYLLWKKDPQVSFNFEFRNSVEHWYPQNPSDNTFERWDDVDNFGNLCIIQREVNSKFSNMDPEAKKTTFEKMIEKGSLKLRLMSNLTNSKHDWKSHGAHYHGEEMIRLLKEACN